MRRASTYRSARANDDARCQGLAEPRGRAWACSAGIARTGGIHRALCGVGLLAGGERARGRLLAGLHRGVVGSGAIGSGLALAARIRELRLGRRRGGLG